MKCPSELIHTTCFPQPEKINRFFFQWTQPSCWSFECASRICSEEPEGFSLSLKQIQSCWLSKWTLWPEEKWFVNGPLYWIILSPGASECRIYQNRQLRIYIHSIIMNLECNLKESVWGFPPQAFRTNSSFFKKSWGSQILYLPLNFHEIWAFYPSKPYQYIFWKIKNLSNTCNYTQR